MEDYNSATLVATDNDYGSGGSSPVIHHDYVFTPNFGQGNIRAIRAEWAANFYDVLEQEQQDWADHHENAYYQIVQYYLDHYNTEEVGFAIQALEEMMEGSDVFFDDKIIIDDSLKNNPCLNSVFEQLGEVAGFQQYLANFDGEFSVANLTLKGSTTISDTINAITEAPQNYMITINFNINNLNRPALSVARTYIHEMIHAEIFRKLLSCAGLPNLNYNNYSNQQWKEYIITLKDSYPGLYDYYVRYEYNIPAASQATHYHHQLMAQHYREIIKNALIQFDSSQSNEIYEALAWEGLIGTQAWDDLTQMEKDNIKQTINTFNSSNTDCQ